MSAVNKFEFADWLCMEGLDRLLNELNIAGKFNTDYNSEFDKEFPVGKTVRVPLPWRPQTRRNSMGYSPQAIERTHTTVTVDQIAGVDFEWDSVEQALELSRGRDKVKAEYLTPAMDAIAQEIESACALFATQNTPNVVGALGTNPATFDAVFGAAKQRMDELAVPSNGRDMILASQVQRTLSGVAVSYFNPPDAVSKMFKKGIIGEAQGFQTFVSNSLYETTAGVWAGSVTVSGAGQSGSSLVITATAGDTFKKGDVISIGSVFPVNPMTRRRPQAATTRQFVITQDLTAAGGAGADTLQIYPAIVGPGQTYQNVDALPADGATITLYPGTTAPSTGPKVGINGLALHRDAFALVGVKLQNPTSAEIASYARDPKTGLSVSFVRAFDPTERRWINRFDVLFGFGRLHAASHAVRVLGA